MANGLPKGWREGHGGDLACPHRDCSVCPACAAAHVECVEVYGQHFWVPNERERAEIRASLASKSDAPSR